MKKQLRTVLTLILSAVMLVSLSPAVFADMSAPETKSYEVIVNPGGAVTKDGDFIPEGTVLTVRWEYSFSDGIWGAVEWNGKYNVEINLADVSNGDVIPEKTGNLSDWREGHYQVFTENGVDVYAGPGHAYKVLFNVPNGGRICGDHWVVDWVYVRYGDQGGWICPRSTGVVTYFDEPVTVWMLKDTELLKEQQFAAINHEGNTLCTIPAGTKLDACYSSVAYGLYYVTYEGQSGWVDTFRSTKAIAEEKTKNYKATEDGALCLFNEPFDYNEGLFDPAGMLEMKKGDRFSVRFDLWTYEYNPVTWYYIESDSASGWTPVCRNEEMATHPYSSDFHEYVNVGNEQSDDEQITAPDTDTTEDVTEITAPDTDGTENDKKEPENADDLPGMDITEPVTDTKENEILPPTPDTSDGETKPAGFFSSPTAIIVLCVVSAVVLALVAVVLLVIIRKKKK